MNFLHGQIGIGRGKAVLNCKRRDIDEKGGEHFLVRAALIF